MIKDDHMRVDFRREQTWWDAKAPIEERDLEDEPINRALRWREIERHLAGVETILEVGAGTGVFSIPLAQRGLAVTHLDLSPAMLAMAREKTGDLATLHLVEGNAVELPFADRSFDLVLNLDGAISFCGREAERALRESCRVAKGKLIVTVSSRAWLLPVTVLASLHVSGRFLPAVYAMLERGEWHQEQFPENHLLSKGCTQDYLGPLQAFLPSEVRGIIEQAGMTPLCVRGLGSLAAHCEKSVIETLVKDESLLQEFLDLCERYDADILPDGPGTRQRAGLLAVAVRR